MDEDRNIEREIRRCRKYVFLFPVRDIVGKGLKRMINRSIFLERAFVRTRVSLMSREVLLRMRQGRSQGGRTLRQDNPVFRRGGGGGQKRETPLSVRSLETSKLSQSRQLSRAPFFSSLILRDCSYVILNVIAAHAKDIPGRCHRASFPERIFRARSSKEEIRALRLTRIRCIYFWGAKIKKKI